MAGSYKYGSEPLCSVERWWEILEELRCSRNEKIDPVVWSHLDDDSDNKSNTNKFCLTVI
jgi:hypothetical protein